MKVFRSHKAEGKLISHGAVELHPLRSSLFAKEGQLVSRRLKRGKYLAAHTSCEAYSAPVLGEVVEDRRG